MAQIQKVPVKTDPHALAPRPHAMMPLGAPFDALRREIEEVFDSFRSGMPGFPFPRRGFDLEHNWPRLGGFAPAPATDVAEREQDYEITAELPGMDEADIEVRLANGTLTIKGEKKDEREEKRQDYYLSERRYGAFTRSFRVPEGVDADKVEARFSKGVLTVTLPKTMEAQRQEKKIEIKAA